MLFFRALPALVLAGVVALGTSATPCHALAVYGCASTGDGPSDFYRIYPAGFYTVLVGPTGFSNISGMEVHPYTGELYATAVRTGDGTPVLITIDRLTGAGTEIGPTGLGSRVSDLAFRPSDGALFGHDAIPGNHRLYRFDIATGAGTDLGPTNVFGGGNALEFGPDGQLYLYTDTQIYVLNQANGAGGLVGPANYGIAGYVRAAAMDQLTEGQFIFLVKVSDLDTNDPIETRLATGVMGDAAITANASPGPFEFDALAYDPRPAAYIAIRDFGGPGTPSDFYTLDPITGVATLMGPTGFNQVGAMDQSPIGAGEVLYATGVNPDTGTPVLLTIDPTTGDGTEVGPTGISDRVADIALHQYTTLYAYEAVNDPVHTLFTLDLASGGATFVGDPGTANQGGNGIAAAFGPAGALYHSSDQSFNELDLLNGTATPLATPPTYLSPMTGNPRPPAMDAHMGGALWALVKTAYGGSGTTYAAAVNPGTQTFAAVSDIGRGDIDGMAIRESLSPQSQVTSPNGGEGYLGGTTQTIRWNTFRDHTIDYVELSYSTGVELYASSGSSLYRVDVLTGATALVGPIGYDRVGSIVAHPAKQTLYSAAEIFGAPSLIEIDPDYGNGIPVGETFTTSGAITDLAFRPSNWDLFAYDGTNNPGHHLFTLDINTGRGKLVGSTNLSFAGGNGIAFSSADVLYHANGADLNTLDPLTGAATQVAPLGFPGGLSNPRIAAMDFHPGTGVLYALVMQNSANTQLATIDVNTGVVTLIGDTFLTGLDGLAFVPGPFTVFASNEANDGQADWVLPFTYTDLARIRVRMVDQVGQIAKDISNGYFSILDPTDAPAGKVSVVSLAPLSPNPFTAETSIRFRTAADGPVRLSVFDARGRLAKQLYSGTKIAGEHVIRWDGRDGNGASVPAGIYVVRLEANGETVTRRGVVLR